MSEQKSQFIAEQIIHGYRDGHELLASSIKISREAQRIFLSMTDLSGYGFEDGFDGYLTGYPVMSLGKYALGRTWYATEIERPGCVWTHTLLIDFSDIPILDAPQCLLQYFQRPTSINEMTQYERPLDIQVFHGSPSVPENINERACVRLLDAMYGEPIAPLIIEASHVNELEDLVFSLWAQQWPRLRRCFSFCTGSLSLRSFGNSFFDLQIVPKRRRLNVDRLSSTVRRVELSNLVESSECEEWLSAAATDLRRGNSPLRKFLWDFGADAPGERESFRPLADCFLIQERVRRNLLPVDELVTIVGKSFPKSENAVRLKRDIFFPSKSNLEDSSLYSDESDLLLAALRTKYYSSFNLEEFRIAERALKVLRSDSSMSSTLLRRLFESNRNAIGQRVLDIELSAFDADRLRIYFENDDQVFKQILLARPTLLYTEDLWRSSRHMQCECLTLAAQNASSSQLVIDVEKSLETALSAGSDAIAQTAYELLGKTAIFTALSWIDETDAADRYLPNRWYTLLKSNAAIVLHWFSDGNRPNRIDTLTLLTNIIDPKDVMPESISTTKLIEWSNKISSGSEPIGASRVFAFLLAIGLRREEETACDLVLSAFPEIHELLLNSRLGWKEWSWLEQVMPSKDWFFSFDWDKADKLRRALLDGFDRLGWPPKQLNKAAYSKKTKKYLIKTAKVSSRWEKIVREGIGE